MKLFGEAWAATDGPKCVVPGKLALSAINANLQSACGISVTPGQIAGQFEEDDIPAEIRTFLHQLDMLTSD